MKTIKWILFSIAATMAASGCYIDADDDDGFFGNCIDGNGSIVSRQLNVPAFTGISLPISADVVITQGSVQEVTVEGRPNVIDELELDVRNGVWEIEFDRCVRDIGSLRVFITMPELTSLSIPGSGTIFSDNTFVIGDLEIDIPGSGDIDLVIEADDIDTSIPGSGRLTLEGKADEVSYSIPGSGDVRAFAMECRTADISISGSGDIELFVTEFLKARISGSGKVFYKGDPSLDVSISGSGEVVDAN